MTPTTLDPTTLHTILSTTHTVLGGQPFTTPAGPLAVLTLQVGSELAIARPVLDALQELVVPTICIATDGAADLRLVHAAAATLGAPLVSDPYGTLRARLGLRGGSTLLVAADHHATARFELRKVSRRAIFSVLFDAAWRAAPTAAVAK